MLLGIHVGTGSSKALLRGADDAVAGEGCSPHPVSVAPAGLVETDPEAWWASAVVRDGELEAPIPPTKNRGTRRIEGGSRVRHERYSGALLQAIVRAESHRAENGTTPT